MSSLSKWLSLAFVVLVLDQITKYWVVTTLEYGERVPITSFFAWVRWHNDGAAFSFLAGSGGWQRWFFVVIAVAFSAYLIYEISRLPKQEKIMGWVFGLILGGALGNLVDRVINGYVVDFVLLHYNQHFFPAFNVADSALFCGAALWILMMILERKSTSVESAND